MTITLKATSYSNITRFDIPIIKFPQETLPGDLMIMQIVTLNENERIPSLNGWFYLSRQYAPGLSQFLFYKIANQEPSHYNVVRNKSGYNRISIYTFVSDSGKVLKINSDTIQFNNNRNKKQTHKLEDFNIVLQDNQITSGDSKNFITFTLTETEEQYTEPFEAAVITGVSEVNNGCALLEWQGEETFDIEISQDKEVWSLTSVMQTSALSAIIDNLKPSTLYYFRIVNYKNGQYKYSEPVNYQTPDIILLRSTVKNNASTMNPRILVSPAPVEKGDLMIMQISYIGNMNITKISHSWKLLQHSEYKNYGLYVYYKYATRKEPASYLVYHEPNCCSKVLMAVAAFYSANQLPLRLVNSAIQNNQPSKKIEFPHLLPQAHPTLQIGLVVRDLESSYKFSTQHTTLWDYEPKLRSTAVFSTNFLEPLGCNFGTSITAAVSIIEGEFKKVDPPKTPENIRIAPAKGTTIRIFKNEF